MTALPHPGAPRMDNIIATLLVNGNGSHRLNLDRIAACQGFNPAEFTCRFAALETAYSLQPCGETDGK